MSDDGRITRSKSQTPQAPPAQQVSQKLGKQQQRQQPSSSSSSAKPAPIMSTIDDVMAMLANMSKDHAVMAKDVATLKTTNQTLTDKVTALERSVSPSGRRRRFEDSVEPPDSDKSGPSNKEKETSTSASTAPVSVTEKDRFRIEELGYFDGTGDVYAFIDRLRTVSKVKTDKLIQEHITLSFMNPSGSNEAYNWWISELSNDTRKYLLNAKSINPVCDALQKRFGLPEHQLLDQLNQIRYTRKDAAERKPATAFVGQVMTLTNRLNQKGGLQLAFTKFEPSLQSTLPYPRGDSDMDDFMEQVRIRQTAWYEQYRTYGKSTYSAPSTLSFAPTTSSFTPGNYDRDKRNNSYGRNRGLYQYRGNRGPPHSDQKLLPAAPANAYHTEPIDDDDPGPFLYVPDDDVPEYAEANFADAHYDGHDIINKQGHRWRAHKYPRDE